MCRGGIGQDGLTVMLCVCEVESARAARQNEVVLVVDEVMEEEERILRRRAMLRFKYSPNVMDLQSWFAQGIHPPRKGLGQIGLTKMTWWIGYMRPWVFGS